MTEPINPLLQSRTSMWRSIKADLDRFRVTDGRSYLTMLVMCPGSLACISYRIGNAIWSYSGPFSKFSLPLKAVYVLANRFVEIVTGISIAPTAKIDPGLYIGHFGQIFIGDGVKMGSNCNLSQGITIGISVRGNRKGTPCLGDRVYIAPGAKLFGAIEIGDDVAIGANAVVTKSLPNRAVAVGIPAQVISNQGSFEYILYKGMDTDSDRLASLALRSQDRIRAVALEDVN